MQILFVVLNLVYGSSILITLFKYPAGSTVRDFETDEISHTNVGVTWFAWLYFAIFNGINYYCYGTINKSNEMGVKPSTWIDILGVNTLAILAYSISYKGIKIYWIIPIYAISKLVSFIWPFCCAKKQATEEDEDDGKSNRQKKRENGEKKQKVKYMK